MVNMMGALDLGRLLLLPVLLAGFSPSSVAQDPEDEWAIMLANGQRKLDQGNLTSAENVFVEVLDAFEEEPEASRPSPVQADLAQAGLWDIDMRRGRYDRVVEGVEESSATLQSRPIMQGLWARALRKTGRYDQAAARWRDRVAKDERDFEARYEWGDALYAAGLRKAAREQWQAAVDLSPPEDSVGLTFRGRCLWRLGGPENLVASSRDLVKALGLDADEYRARTTLGVLRFEVYGEAAGLPSGEKALANVIEEHGNVEEALLAMYRLRSSNMLLEPGKTERYLERALRQNPRSVPGLILRGASVLDDRRFQDAAEILDRALAVDARDKDALAHRATVAYLLDDQEAYQTLREQAQRGDANLPDMDRILADHLVALYRFADSLPFYEAALANDPTDIDVLQGMARAYVYTGQGAKAQELLAKAKEREPGYVDAWRNNMLAVQDLLNDEYVSEKVGKFEVVFHRDDIEVLREYLLPLCLEAFDVLGNKYDYRPDKPVRLEVLHTWDDFSVRTIGFRGFTALGACFGPFITLVSPRDRDLRQQDFMWEATVWHEFTHVLTLGVSRHRVPRWLTEGFSVYEERERDPSWERGMDRELFNAYHNRDIPPVRLLNRLFRGDRILFGYYQGGLIVELLARDYGFGKAIELLQAFGDDLGIEEAFERALGMSSRDFDQKLLKFVAEEKLDRMQLVPQFDDGSIRRLLGKVAANPKDVKARVDLAWAYVQRGNPVDAGPQLAAALKLQPDNPEAMLVRADLLRRRGAAGAALDYWERGFAAGADDFDSRITYGRALLSQGDVGGAERQFQRAKKCWPNCTEQQNAPELLLASIYRESGRREQALMEMKSYCRRTARAYDPRWQLAEFEREAGNRASEAEYLEQCNQIDPFSRRLHVLLGEAYEALGQDAQAALEYEVAAAVMPPLDRVYMTPQAERPATGDPAEVEARGDLRIRAARLRWQLGARERARELLERVIREGPDTAAASSAAALQQEWRSQ